MIVTLPDAGRSDRHSVLRVSSLATLGADDVGALRYFSSSLNFWNGTAWQSLLSIAGGSGGAGSFTPVNGAVLYSTTTSISTTSAPSTSNQLLKSTSGGSPAWSNWLIDGSGHLTPNANGTVNVGSDSLRVSKLYINKIKRENEYHTRFSTTFSNIANQVAYVDLGDVTAVAGMEIAIWGGFNSGQGYGVVRKRFCWFRNSGSTSYGFNDEEVVDAFGFVATRYAIGTPEIYNTSSLRVPIYQITGGTTIIVDVKVWSESSTSVTNLEGAISLIAPTTVVNSATRNHCSRTGSDFLLPNNQLVAGTTSIRSGAGAVATPAVEIANARHITFKDSTNAFTNAGFILYNSSHQLFLGTANATRWMIDGANGHLIPTTGSTYDIGTSSAFVRNQYAQQVNTNELLIGHTNSNLNRFLFAQTNSTDRGLFNPIWEAIGSGKALFTDEEFSTGSNSVVVYDNLSSGKVTHTRQTGRDVVPNSTATWIKISYDGTGSPGVTVSPGFGGFQQTFIPGANRSYVVRFIAKIPTGYTLAIALNSVGVNSTNYWLTNNVGTGKWEQYAYVIHAGEGIGLNTVTSISTAGSGYAIGNVLTLSGGTLASPGGTAATVTVSAVDGSGGVTGVTVTNRGRYVTAPSTNPATTGGAGSGCVLNTTYLTFSTAGFTYILTGGPNVAFDWYLASLNVYEVNLSGFNYLNADKLSLGTVPSARVSGAYSSITGLGTLTSLTVNGTTTLTGAFTQSGGNSVLAFGASNSLKIANSTSGGDPNVAVYIDNNTIQLQDQAGNTKIHVSRSGGLVGLGGIFESGYDVRIRGLAKCEELLIDTFGDSNGLRATGVGAAATGIGLELQYDSGAGGGTSFVQSYDRDGAVFMKLHLRGSTVDLSTGGSTVMSISSLAIICNQQISSNVSTGTSPLQVVSTTKVNNFTSHYLGTSGQDDSFFKNADCPVGTVVAFLKSFGATPTPPANWVEANGQVLSDSGSIYNTLTLPDLNGSGGTKRFLRGSTTSGTTGGSEQHNHSVAATLSSISTGTTSSISVVTAVTTPVGNASTLPSYYEVVYIIKVK
jgi:hypothetical protein